MRYPLSKIRTEQPNAVPDAKADPDNLHDLLYLWAGGKIPDAEAEDRIQRILRKNVDGQPKPDLAIRWSMAKYRNALQRLAREG